MTMRGRCDRNDVPMRPMTPYAFYPYACEAKIYSYPHTQAPHTQGHAARARYGVENHREHREHRGPVAFDDGAPK